MEGVLEAVARAAAEQGGEVRPQDAAWEDEHGPNNDVKSEAHNDEIDDGSRPRKKDQARNWSNASSEQQQK